MDRSSDIDKEHVGVVNRGGRKVSSLSMLLVLCAILMMNSDSKPHTTLLHIQDRNTPIQQSENADKYIFYNISMMMSGK